MEKYSQSLMVLRALVNVCVMGAVLAAGVGLSRGSKSRLARPLWIMFVCISLEILFITCALFLLEWERHIAAIVARLVELGGILYFLMKLSNGKG